MEPKSIFRLIVSSAVVGSDDNLAELASELRIAMLVVEAQMRHRKVRERPIE